MAKIAFFAHDPGGANAIFPLIKPLSLEHQVFVFAKGTALEKLPNPILIPDNMLEQTKPDLLITGTSANDFTEKRLWVAAKRLGIKTIAILDHWCNYGIRFSKYKMCELDKYHCDKTFDFLPDYIVVMDEFAQQEMAKEGVPIDKILPLGNPHFEFMFQHTKSLDVSKYRRRLNVADDDFLITFASEPDLEDLGKGSELIVVKHLLEILKEVNQKIRTIIRPHPRENPEKFSRFQGVIVDKQSPFLESIMMSNLIISMTSMYLVEALLLGRNILSYQPGATSPDAFILTRKKLIPLIAHKEDFAVHLKAALTSGPSFDKMKTIYNGIENNIKFIGEILCQKQF